MLAELACWAKLRAASTLSRSYCVGDIKRERTRLQKLPLLALFWDAFVHSESKESSVIGTVQFKYGYDVFTLKIAMVAEVIFLVH
jgi:hypothetical protein